MSRQSALTKPSWPMRANANTWSSQQLAQLRELASRGYSPSQVAQELRRSESAVRNKATMHGVSFRRPRSTDVTVLESARACDHDSLADRDTE